MAQKPRGLVTAPDDAVDLKGAHALLARIHQVDDEAPFRQRDLRSLANRVDRNSELLAAVIALNEARTMLLAVQTGQTLTLAAMRAEGAIGPDPRLEPLTGLLLVVKDGVAEVRRHRTAPL